MLQPSMAESPREQILAAFSRQKRWRYSLQFPSDPNVGTYELVHAEEKRAENMVCLHLTIATNVFIAVL